MTWLRRAWLWLMGALVAVGAGLVLLWRRATRQRDEARAERDGARRSAERERELSVVTETIEQARITAGQIVAAKRAEAERRAEAARSEVESADDVDDLARIETARRRARETTPH